MEWIIVIWFFIIAGFVLGLVINYIISKQFYEAACFKGYDNKKYLWLCFFFGWIGYLLVIALPTKATVLDGSNVSSDELPDL